MFCEILFNNHWGTKVFKLFTYSKNIYCFFISPSTTILRYVNCLKYVNVDEFKVMVFVIKPKQISHFIVIDQK